MVAGFHEFAFPREHSPRANYLCRIDHADPTNPMRPRLVGGLFSRFVGDADEAHAAAHPGPAPSIRTRPVPDVPMAAE